MPPRKRKQRDSDSDSASAQTTGQNKAQRQDEPKVKPQVQVQVPVDEAFRQDAAARVYIDKKGTIFDISLNQTNIGANNNKFYLIQLLQSKNGKNFFVHTRWGRVGDFGQSKTIGPCDLDAALVDFKKKFKDKSGLPWEKRFDEPKGGKKYTVLEKSYEDDDDADDKGVKKEEGDEEGKKIKLEEQPEPPKSTLPIQTQRLIELIFNEVHFNSVLNDIGYNKNKLPLGKLGKSTLRTGFKHLQELASLIKQPLLAQEKYGKSQREAIEDFSNRYYSTIPHITGRNAPPLIDNNYVLQREVGMLDTLTDMEVANAIMKAIKDSKSISLVDQRYNDLHMKEMTPLDHNSQEYQGLAEYLTQSTGSTHSYFDFKIEDIFRIEREGETERFQQSSWARIQAEQRNRLLLWHGSRTTNFGGILSQGLRIAPPEAPMSGYAFGKGLYLADCSSKSANYCHAGLSGGTGLLLLCEAELAKPLYEIPTGDANAQELARKANCFSTKGVGKMGPQKWKDAGYLNADLKGVMMPDGPVEENKLAQHGYLQYNEYIAYDVAQLRLKYLLKVKMN